jgi:hypothetical protein
MCGRWCSGIARSLGAVLMLSLFAPASGQASVHVGSNLRRAINQELDCATSSCTVTGESLVNGAAAPGGVVSPANGFISSWQIRSGAATNVTSLRVIKPLSSGLFTGEATSAPVTPFANVTSAFPAHLPISIGDRIGLDVPGAPVDYFVAGTGAVNRFQPVLADGASGRGPSSTSPWELAVSVFIEPTSTFTVRKVEPLRHGKVQITAALPNPGVLAAGDLRTGSLAAHAAKRKPTPLIRHTRLQVSAPGTAQMRVLPTKAAKSALARGKKVRAELDLAFVPTDGVGSFPQLFRPKLRP